VKSTDENVCFSIKEKVCVAFDIYFLKNGNKEDLKSIANKNFFVFYYFFNVIN
jgi:hypothetical protein